MALWLKELPHEIAEDKGCFGTITANDDLSYKAGTGRTKTEHKRILYIRQQKQTNATLNFFQVLVCLYSDYISRKNSMTWSSSFLMSLQSCRRLTVSSDVRSFISLESLVHGKRTATCAPSTFNTLPAKGAHINTYCHLTLSALIKGWQFYRLMLPKQIIYLLYGIQLRTVNHLF